jgi:hypothetical protein
MNAVVLDKAHAVPERLPERNTELSPTTPMAMVQYALANGADMAKLEKLIDLAERWDATQARKAFTAAMAEFKQNPPEILKDKHVAYTTSKGMITTYDHATLGNVVGQIIKRLADVGISHSWKLDQSTPRIKVTCILTHRDGHCEITEMSASADDSGGKNSIQAIASTKSYLERYTLLAATGLATNDGSDDDGVAGGSDDDETPKVAEPDGYQRWKADVSAVADDGTPALQKCWSASDLDLRQYATAHDKAWWAATKSKAEQVKS